MRILIISYYFPPYNSIGAVRVGKFARYLIEQGFDVRVVTADKQSWKGILPTTLRLEIPQANVVYAGNSLAYLLSSLFVRFFTRRNSSSGHFGWFPFAYLASNRLIKQWRPNVIYASGLPFTAFMIAHWLSIRYKIPWIAELRDLWGENPTYPAWRKKIESRWEYSVLRSASGLVTVSEPLADTLRKKYDLPVIVSYNGFDLEDFPSLTVAQQSCDHRLKIMYAGTIYKNWRDPTPLFLALQKLGTLSQEICVDFYGPELGFVKELANQFGVVFSVQVHPPVPYEESLALQRQADILLFLQWTDSREKGIFTGKLFEYIGARRPILSIGPTDNEPAQMISNKGFGVAFDQPDKIAVQLRQWITQKQQTGIPMLPIESTLPYSRNLQLQSVEKFLRKVVAFD